MNLYEHQSTYNPNMPLRDLIYVASLLAEIVEGEEAGIQTGREEGSDLKLISQICRKLTKDKTPEYDEMKIYEALHSCVA